jgi:hypothetical protein
MDLHDLDAASVFSRTLAHPTTGCGWLVSDRPV